CTCACLCYLCQAEDGIRDRNVTGVQTCALPISPTSKVVGDMALSMVAAGLTRAQVEDPEVDVAFPDSVGALMRGDLGQPLGGFRSEERRVGEVSVLR